MKRYGILDTINNPNELRELSYESMGTLCTEIREFIVDNVSQTGGHLASNLGIVELSVALEREFDSTKDRIIYDVGHQSYVHKILTGRKDAFDTLRQYGGISGFMKPEESGTDPCITGHASSSVSVALGMAYARTQKNQKYHCVAVIGDGAMTGGMAYEALNSAGASKEPLLVILNDNNMSIAQNVGGLSKHLTRLRVRPKYLTAKTKVKTNLSKIPGGKIIINSISAIKARLKRFLLPGTIFEQMGFTYLGPIDGHNMASICELLSLAKKMKKPVLIHVMTRKGKGYAPSEENPEKFHGVSKFDAATGESLTAPKEDFSACFGNELCKLAEKDGRISAVTAAMPSGTGLTEFAEKYPERFYDVGIAEEHAVAMAAGMAKQGLIPVVAMYSTFLQRAYDQLIHDVAIEPNIHAIFMIDRAGIVGADGATHNGVFDVGFIRQIPGFRLYAPANFLELRTMLSQAIYRDSGPVAIRYPRGTQSKFSGNTAGEKIAEIQCGEDAVLISYGTLIDEMIEAADVLEQLGISVGVYKFNDLSAPIDAAFIAKISTAKVVLCAEEVIANGSIGEAVAAELAEKTLFSGALVRLNTGNRFLPHGSVEEIRKQCGLYVENIRDKILEALNG